MEFQIEDEDWETLQALVIWLVSPVASQIRGWIRRGFLTPRFAIEVLVSGVG